MMKKCVFLLLLMCSILQLSSQNRADSIRRKLLSCDQSSVLVAAHRGDWRNFPENSLAAIESAINMGVDIVELDVQRTKDGVLILMHDASLNRTTTGKGKIAEITWDSIAKLKLKNGCAIRTIHKVPTLEEALLLAKGKIMVNLDKADRYFNEVYALLKKTGTEKQIIMKGSKPADKVIAQFGNYLDKVIYMPIVNLDNDNAGQLIEDFISGFKPVAFELLFKSDANPLPLRLASELSGRSLIWYNTLWDTMAGAHDDDASLRNFDEGYGYLIDRLGARIIQTDRPQFLLNYLRSRHLHP
ncbi:MAG: glycerophosphodiester phosphodiesterase family protein [Muribaculaceae bacterium]